MAATWDPTHIATGVVLSNGNMTASSTAVGVDLSALALPAITSGQKVRAEALIQGTNNHIGFGVGNASTNLANDGTGYLGRDANSIGYYSDGRVIVNNSVPFTYATYAINDIIDFDVDRTAGTIEFFKNGVSQGAPISHGVPGDLYAGCDLKFGAGSSGMQLTLHQPGSLTYAAPSGFTDYGATGDNLHFVVGEAADVTAVVAQLHSLATNATETPDYAAFVELIPPMLLSASEAPDVVRVALMAWRKASPDSPLWVVVPDGGSLWTTVGPSSVTWNDA